MRGLSLRLEDRALVKRETSCLFLKIYSCYFKPVKILCSVYSFPCALTTVLMRGGLFLVLFVVFALLNP